MKQDDINANEWGRTENWAGLGYRSKADTRVIVPKRRGIGWTLNFGHRLGRWLCFGLLAMPVMIAATVALIRFHASGK